MKKIYSLFLMCLFWQIINTTPLQAQTWGMNFTWVQQGAGSSSEDGRSIAKDASGNVYVVGNFHGTVAFGSTSLNSSGGKDVFIVKYDASGNVLWARKAGGTGYDAGYGIAVDDSGNAYLTGLFSGTAAFGSTYLTSSGEYDVFLAKYDASGNGLWAQQAGGTGYDIGTGIALDNSGNAYLTGYFREAATFGSTSLTSSGLDDVFIAKYDASGNVLWAQQAGGTGYDVGTGIAVDDSGNAYLAGYFRETATFGSTSLTSSGLDDVFIAKYDALGNVLWAQQAGGTGYDRSNGIAVDGLGNAYLTGFFREAATFGSTTLTSSGLDDVFIAKYSASGNALWAQKAGGTGYDIGYGIAVDNSGNAYLTGSFQATTTFGSTSLTSSGKYDIFFAKYSASGNAMWALKAGGTGGNGYDGGYGIAVDGADNVYVTGRFYGTAVFGSTSLSASGDWDDAFIARLNWGLIPPTVTGAERCGPGAVTLTASGAADGNYRWYTTETGGNPIASASDWTYITPSLTATTTYYVSVVDADAESQRTAVTATIKPIPAAPEVSASLTYCQGSAAAALTARGSSLKWYGAATGGSGSTTAPTPSTATAGTYYYYVSQTVNNCESERATIEVTVKAAPAVDAGSDQTVCFNEEAFTLSGFSPAGGSWSGTGVSGEGVFSPATAGAGTHTLTYTVTQDNCTATDTKTITVRAEVTLSPFTSALCQDNTGFILTGGQPAGGTYSGTGVSNGVFDASTAGAGTHTISYTYTANGCTATASQDIIVNPIPAAPEVSSSMTYCQGSAAVVLTAEGSNLKWYAAATGGSGSATAPTLSTATAGTYYYYVSQTVNNCESERATIEVVVKACEVENARDFTWARQGPGNGSSVGASIAKDAFGNIYITGNFWGSIQFGSTSLTSSGNQDVFIAKYSASGKVLWAQQAGGTSSDQGHSIAVDNSGNAYLTGYFRNTAAFGSTTLTSSGERDVFIAKYDASGNALWAQQAGGTDYDMGYGIALDNSGNAYITGNFRGTAAFGSTSLASSSVDADVFIAKYDASGKVLWAQQAGGTDYDTGTGIAVDNSGNAYLTGFFNGTTAFGSTMLTSSGEYDVFLAKYDASGNALWAQKAGGKGDDQGKGIAVDGSGNAYITGYFNGTVTLGSISLTSSGESDVFIAKYSASGNVLWGQSAGGTGYDEGSGITLDSSGNAYVTGWFEASATFGSTSLASSGSKDVFLAKYAASSNILWAQKAGGTRGDYAYAYGIAVDNSDNASVTGWFFERATFGSTSIATNGTWDVFLARLGSIASPSVTGAERCGPGTITLSASGAAAGNYRWYTAASGGSSFASGASYTTPDLTVTTTYYVSVVREETESERTAVTATINPIPAAPQVSAITCCQGSAAVVLTAEGSNLKWYAAATGGTGSATAPTLSTATAGTYYYYVSQTVNNCESERARMEVVVTICKMEEALDFSWARQGAGDGTNVGASIAKDALGNIYVTGSFSGSIQFGSISLTSSGSQDVFLAKYSASGNVLWAQRAGGTDSDEGYGIVVDNSGNAYVTGKFSGTATFGSMSLISSGSQDVFLAKYDASGNALWAQKAGGTGYDKSYGIAVDNSGNAYVTGFFSNSEGYGEIFIAKYSAFGNALWAQKAGHGRGHGIALDGSGNAYVTGTIGSDVFIAKYSASGNALWAQKAGGIGGDVGCGIAVDNSGNAYVTGYFDGTAAFGSTSLTSSGSQDVFLAKYDASGNALWAQRAGGENYDIGYGIAVDGSGNAYLTGRFWGTTTFGSTLLTSSGGDDVFIAKFGAFGNVLWVQKAGGTGSDIGHGIALDNSGNAYVTGEFKGTATFGSNSLTSSGSSDVFIAKLGLTPPTVTKAERCGPGALTLTASGAAAGNYRWYTTETGGSPIASASDGAYTTPALTGTTTYYVSVVSGAAESQRTAVTATINPIPAAPEVTASMTYCQGSAAVALMAEGSNLKWYGAATGGTGSATAPTPSTATAGTSYYYVSQTVNNCESERATIEVVVNALQTVNAGSKQTVCASAGAVTLSGFSPAGGSWSGTGVSGEGVFSPATAGVGTHTLTYTYTANGCAATATKDITVSTCTGIAESALAASLLLYPNPTQDKLQVILPLPGKTPLQLRLLDTKGQVVLKQTFSSVSGEFKQVLNLKDAPAGVYMLQLITQEEVINKRIVKE